MRPLRLRTKRKLIKLLLFIICSWLINFWAWDLDFIFLNLISIDKLCNLFDLKKRGVYWSEVSLLKINFSFIDYLDNLKKNFNFNFISSFFFEMYGYQIRTMCWFDCHIYLLGLTILAKSGRSRRKKYHAKYHISSA